MSLLTKQQFEETAARLTATGEVPVGWTIRWSEGDGEWYVRWSNGLTDGRHRERRAHVRGGRFFYI